MQCFFLLNLSIFLFCNFFGNFFVKTVVFILTKALNTPVNSFDLIYQKNPIRWNFFISSGFARLCTERLYALNVHLCIARKLLRCV